MPLLRKPIKISVAAKMLGVSASAIREGKAGTNVLTVFRRPGCHHLFVWESEVNRMLDKIEIVRRGADG